jgi:hypothetical protein
VTASTGKPYTLHLDLPESAAEPSKAEAPMPKPSAPPDGPPDSPTLGTTNNEDLIEVDVDDPPDGADGTGNYREAEGIQSKKRDRLRREREAIERMYCPCPGYAYNSLAGDKNVLVSFCSLWGTR